MQSTASHTSLTWLTAMCSLLSSPHWWIACEFCAE